MKVLGIDWYFGWPGSSPGHISVWISCLHQALAISVACGLGEFRIMSLLSGQELESLGSILSCPGPSLCYVPRCALERDEVSRKTNRNLGMTSAFKELYLQCITHIVLTICRMSFMKLMSKRMKCSWQRLASEEIWITLVEIFLQFTCLDGAV